MKNKRFVINKAFKLTAILFIVFFITTLTAIKVESGEVEEYKVKAAFLYNFAKFIEWPDKAFSKDSDALYICILGDDPFGESIESIKGKTIKGKKVVIKNYTSLEEINACQILFISSSEKNNLKSILTSANKLHALTVSDTEGFSEHGGMINLISTDGRIGFEINLSIALKEGIVISSQLLKLAKKVIE